MNTFFCRLGKIDVKDNFDGSAVASEYRKQFVAKPLANNAATPFPSKGLGISGQWDISKAWYFRAGIVDAQSNKRTTGFNTAFHDEDYYFNLAEVGLRTDLLGRAGTYRFTTCDADTHSEITHLSPRRACLGELLLACIAIMLCVIVVV
ncbi:MAG: hypothetical protein J7M40_14225 [Planctomycetes bacterium]|nr:hypothetical protein [Planctomycetota bacterium]